MRRLALERDNTKRIASLPKGKKHWRWEKKPNKLTLHKRLSRKHGKAKDRKCAKCPNQANDWANVTGNYTDDIRDYLPLCRSCHVKLDYTEKRRKQTSKISKEMWEKRRKNK